MRRRSALALAGVAAVAVAVAVPLATTGGGPASLSRPAYAGRVTAIYQAVGDRFRGAKVSSQGLRAMTSALDRAASALAELRPPSDAKRANGELVSATRDYARQVDLVRASLDFGDPATLEAHLREVTAPRAIERVLRELRAKGYRIPVAVVALR